MTTSATIRAQLEKATRARNEAQSRVDQLTEQLHEARVMEAAESRRREQMRAVMARMRQGQWPAGTNGSRMWWHSDEKILIEPVTADEMDALAELDSKGLVVHETGRAA